jgi:hypothetical protein
VGRDRSRGVIAFVAAVVALVGGQAAIGSAEAATTVSVTPASPTMTAYGSPFGESESWDPYMAFVYKNVPAFSLKPGDTIAFDLSHQNDVDIQLQIAMAGTTTNGGDVNAAPFTEIVPSSQVPLNPKGNTTFGDYELTFAAQAPFSFPGGGLLIRFGNPSGAFAADPNAPGSGVLENNALPTDPSGYFVRRDVRDGDGSAPWDDPTRRAPPLLRQPGRFEGRIPIHIALDSNHPSSAHRNDNRRLGFQLDPAASTAPVFVQEHNHVVPRVDELLRLQAALFPCLQILSLEGPVDLGLTVGYLALLKPADGAVELDRGIDQLCCLFPVPFQKRLEGLPNDLDVLLRHRSGSITTWTDCAK